MLEDEYDEFDDDAEDFSYIPITFMLSRVSKPYIQLWWVWEGDRRYLPEMFRDTASWTVIVDGQIRDTILLDTGVISLN